MTDVIKTTVTITVNGRSIEAQPGELLIEVAERGGNYIPLTRDQSCVQLLQQQRRWRHFEFLGGKLEQRLKAVGV